MENEWEKAERRFKRRKLITWSFKKLWYEVKPFEYEIITYSFVYLAFKIGCYLFSASLVGLQKIKKSLDVMDANSLEIKNSLEVLESSLQKIISLLDVMDLILLYSMLTLFGAHAIVSLTYKIFIEKRIIRTLQVIIDVVRIRLEKSAKYNETAAFLHVWENREKVNIENWKKREIAKNEKCFGKY